MNDAIKSYQNEIRYAQKKLDHLYDLEAKNAEYGPYYDDTICKEIFDLEETIDYYESKIEFIREEERLEKLHTKEDYENALDDLDERIETATEVDDWESINKLNDRRDYIWNKIQSM